MLNPSQVSTSLNNWQRVSRPPLLQLVPELNSLQLTCSLTIARTRQDAILPLSKPIKTADGKHTQELFVPKDTLIFASLLGSNTNPDLWGPDSYEWKPERWLTPVPDSVVEARIPGVYSHL
jgi:hypothetical protein